MANISVALKSGLASLGYAAGLGGFGVTQPIGTPYNPNTTPQSLYNQTQAYTFAPSDNRIQGTTDVAPYQSENLMNPSPIGPPGAPAGYRLGGTGSTGGIPTPQPQQPSQPTGGGDGGYGAYLSSLDSQIGGLNDQRSAQESIANNTYNQGLNTVNTQYQQGQTELDANRQKTLRDLSTNLMQMFQQGNAQLGVRGASDSSAAGQYAYALTKMGNQQRGDVQSQYDQNLFKLKNTYDTETKNLELQKNSQLQQIAQWFSEAQSALQGQKGQLAFQQSQQALNTALQLADRVNQEAQSRRATLDQWAANHATSFQQLQQQLAQNSQFQASIPTFQGITGGQQQGGGIATGYGQDTRKKDLFGNPINA